MEPLTLVSMANESSGALSTFSVHFYGITDARVPPPPPPPPPLLPFIREPLKLEKVSIRVWSVSLFFKDVRDRKIVHTDFFLKFSILLFKLYLGENRWKNLQLPMKKYSVSIRLLTITNNSHTDLRTSHAQISGKGCQYKEEDYENKVF